MDDNTLLGVLGLAGCLVVVVAALIRLRPGRGTGEASGLGFKWRASSRDQSKIQARGIIAGRNVTLEAQRVNVNDVLAGRDVSVKAPADPTGD